MCYFVYNTEYISITIIGSQNLNYLFLIDAFISLDKRVDEQLSNRILTLLEINQNHDEIHIIFFKKSIAKMSTAHPHTFRSRRRITKDVIDQMGADVIDQVGAVMKSCNNDLRKCSSLLPGLSRQMIKSIYDRHFNDQICYPYMLYHVLHTRRLTKEKTNFLMTVVTLLGKKDRPEIFRLAKYHFKVSVASFD